MPTVELIYDADCPNVPATRARLTQALQGAGLPAQWQEWDRAAADAPAYARRYGSPTVLVDGQDAAGVAPSDAPSCRIYHGNAGAARGVPGVELLGTALAQAVLDDGEKPVINKLNAVVLLPAIGAALLPKLTYPACWPAYAGLLSAFGVGFFDYTPWLLPLTLVFLVFLVFTLATLAWGARKRRGHGPLAVGLAGTAIIVVGKFGFDADSAIYLGVAVLVGASLWNAWPRRALASPACPACSNSGK